MGKSSSQGSDPPGCLAKCVQAICQGQTEAVDNSTERAETLGLINRRASVERRGGVQMSTAQVLQGLKAKFDQLERLEDEESRKCAEKVGTQDIDFVRMLQPSQFKMFFKRHGIDMAKYGRERAKTVKDLWAEVVFRECELQQVEDPKTGQLSLERFVRVIMVEVEAECADGEVRHLMLKNEERTGNSRRDLYNRMSKKMFDDENVDNAMWRCMLQNMALPEEMCQKQFAVVSTQRTHEYKVSSGFPGLPTSYDMHVVRMRVVNPSDPVVEKLGLPEGKDFKTQHVALIGPPSIRTWVWCTKAAFDAAVEATSGEVIEPAPVGDQD